METIRELTMENYKYYVVWEGFAPGVYDSWEECKQQIDGFKGAKYKSFKSKDAAVKAFRGDASEHIGLLNQVAKAIARTNPPLDPIYNPAIESNSIAVDAACSGNPGKMEYRGVYVMTGKQIFHQGPFEKGTNNIGEFLALVHGLALLKQNNSTLPLYTDSVNAMLWVKQKRCKTKLERTPVNEPIFQLIARAEKWLATHTYTTKIIKWNTKEWGEIPADFGRK